MQALLGDRDWLEQLRAIRTPMSFQVHSVFKRTINLIDVNHNLYTLAASNVAIAPNTIVTDCLTVEYLNAFVGMTIYCDEQHFVFGSQRVCWSTATSWSAILPDYQCFDVQQACRLCAEILNANIPSSNHFDALVYKKLTEIHAELLIALTIEDKAGIEQCLMKSIGLGIGLTPSGDDALVGLCAILAIPGNPAYSSFSACRNVILKARENTNLISYSALFNAAQGKFNSTLINLINSFLSNNTDEIHQQLQALLAIGSSSGADMLRGIYTGLLLINSRRKALCQPK